jgi:hypothetical protein
LLGHVGRAESPVRSRLAQFEEGDVERLKDTRGFAENRGRIAVVDALGIAVGRQADRNAIRAPDRDQALGDFAQQARAVSTDPP